MIPLEKRKVLFIGLAVFSFFAIVILLLLSLKGNKGGAPQKFADFSKIQTYGENTFSPRDINYMVKFQYPSKTASTLTSDEREVMRNFLLEQSIVLEEAKKRNLLTVPESIFAPDKNQQEYNETYSRAKELLEKDVLQMTVEGVFIWFNVGNPEPPMPITQAKEKTRQKMEAIRSDLVSGKITMIEAGERIKQDESLYALDPVYKSNAYAKYPSRDATTPLDSNLKEEDNAKLWKLNTGEFSPLLLGLYRPTIEEEPEDGFWAIYRVVEKTGTISSYDEWLNEKMKTYEAK